MHKITHSYKKFDLILTFTAEINTDHIISTTKFVCNIPEIFNNKNYIVSCNEIEPKKVLNIKDIQDLKKIKSDDLNSVKTNLLTKLTIKLKQESNINSSNYIIKSLRILYPTIFNSRFIMKLNKNLKFRLQKIFWCESAKYLLSIDDLSSCGE